MPRNAHHLLPLLKREGRAFGWWRGGGGYGCGEPGTRPSLPCQTCKERGREGKREVGCLEAAAEGWVGGPEIGHPLDPGSWILDAQGHELLWQGYPSNK